MFRLVPVLGLALIVASCSPGVAEHDGLLAVVDEAGDVLVLTPSGEVVTQIELDPPTTGFQPIWTGPDHVAFVERSGVGGAVVVAGLDGAERRRAEFITAPFYLYPRPGAGVSADIVSLRNHLEGGLAAEVIHGDGSLTALEGDFPFYFTWDDDGRVLAHSANAFLGEVYPELRPIGAEPGAFPAPGSRGNDLAYLDRSTSYLTVISGGGPVGLVEVRGPAQFVVGGDRIAVRSVASGGVPDAVEAAFRQTPTLPANVLAVVDIDDGSIEVVTQNDVLAFFWDPTGRRLLYLGAGESPGELRWHVWEDGTVGDFASFGPDPGWLAEFLPFFDQYAQSMSLWAPDGTAFAFAGTIGDEAGVWVQHLDRSGPGLIAPGSWVAWGPSG